MHRRDLNYKERQMVLELHMFLNHKQDGKIKGGKVYGGNKHNTYISKEDASY